MPSLNPTMIEDASWQHGNVFLDEAQRIRIHYIDCPSLTTEPKGTILLIHGFPETSYQFRHVITPLAKEGYRVVVPDCRGAGESSHPLTGYDKVTVASDLHKLVHDHLKITEPIHVVGHDIGGMTAHAYAFVYPEHTISIIWGECPLPGGTPYESGFKNSPGMWHFTFHQVPDLPEALIAGRERIYLKHFYDRLCVNPSAITPRDLDHYVTVFAQPGGIRGGLEMYRAFDQDSEDNQRMLKEKGKSKIPACNLNGAQSLLYQVAEEQTKQFYETVELALIDGSGHWCAEENPPDFVKKVLQFIGKHTKK